MDPELATTIVDQVESEHIVIVCRDTDANALTAFTKQIGWGRRVRGIVTETDLIQWYERCLRGRFAQQLANALLQHLIEGFRAEFPQNTEIVDFLDERGYLKMKPEKFWWTETDEIAIDGN